MTTKASVLSQLSDRELLAQVNVAVHAERQASAQLIALLMELDTRRLYLGEGFSSLFTYCTQALHLSEHAAYNRIEAARAARRFPVVLDLIAEGAVTLTTIRLLAPHLTLDNHREVLERARRKSKREVEYLVAGLCPRSDVPSAIRKLPTPPHGAALRDVRPAATPAVSLDIGADTASPPPAPPPPRPAEVKPLAPERYKVQFTVSRQMHDKLRRAQDLLRHAVPDGDPAVIFERAITLLVAELERRKTAATDRPTPACRAHRVTVNSRHIPAAVKRTVWQRDGGRCAFNGRQSRCTETGFLEYHHIVPFAEGGESSVANLELRCRRHNAFEADAWFGGRGAPLVRERQPSYGPTRLVPERVGDPAPTGCCRCSPHTRSQKQPWNGAV